MRRIREYECGYDYLVDNTYIFTHTNGNMECYWLLYNFCYRRKKKKTEIEVVNNLRECNMDKWEYKYIKKHISQNEMFLEEFNRLGKDGWELCAYSTLSGISVFKRKIEE